MKPLSALRTATRLLLLAVALSAHAVQPTALSSFDGLEESSVRYAPATDTFTPDEFSNIVDLGEGVFRMTLRYRGDEWDGDRDTTNRDRQRAEIKGLGPHQKHGETFEYRMTWRTSPEFRGSERFCHVFQLKSTDGDSGAPLITVSIGDGVGQATVRYWPAGSRNSLLVREFSWAPHTWQTVCIRVRTSPADDGEVLVSIDGDAFVGVRGVQVSRPDASDYRPKWGLYRGMQRGLPLGDDYVEHRAISARRVGDRSDDEHHRLELAAQALAAASPEQALAWLRKQPMSPDRALATATIIARWAEADPRSAAIETSRLSTADGQADAQLRVLLRWAESDPAAALDWLRTHPPDPSWDDPLWYWATDTTLRYSDRSKALAGAVMIVDADLRARAIDHVVLIWARREPDAAAAYVRTTPALGEKQREWILERIHARRQR